MIVGLCDPISAILTYVHYGEFSAFCCCYI